MGITRMNKIFNINNINRLNSDIIIIESLVKGRRYSKKILLIEITLNETYENLLCVKLIIYGITDVIRLRKY